MGDSVPDIGVVYDERIPEDVIGEFTRIVACEGLSVETRSQCQGGIRAALEWLVPTLAIVHIFRPYFNAFLGEAGKDHYRLLKAGVTALASAVLGKNRKVDSYVVRGGSDVRQDNPYSIALSVVADTGEEYEFKLLLQESLNEQELDAVMDSFLEFLDAYYAQRLDEGFVAELRSVQHVGRTVLVAYDADRGRLTVVDPVPKHVRDRLGR